ncbi:MAG: hypothetical protein U9Q15_05500 [Patescibacteria group bacterium]|nr:hypothetical protein [Patescibacteria group bacterium]
MTTIYYEPNIGIDTISIKTPQDLMAFAKKYMDHQEKSEIKNNLQNIYRQIQTEDVLQKSQSIEELYKQLEK